MVSVIAAVIAEVTALTVKDVGGEAKKEGAS